MGRVQRVRVEVTTEDDDGVVTTHIAEGIPVPGAVVIIEPNWHHTLDRSDTHLLLTEITSVGIHLEVRLGAEIYFHVADQEPATLVLRETPLRAVEGGAE